MPAPTNRITVTIHATDPLSRAGVVSHLQHHPTVQIVSRSRERDGLAPAATVAVVLVDRIDEESAADLRRVLRGGEQRVVLVARELREPDLLTVVEYGVRAIVWRHQATGESLVRAVLQAADGEGCCRRT